MADVLAVSALMIKSGLLPCLRSVSATSLALATAVCRAYSSARNLDLSRSSANALHAGQVLVSKCVRLSSSEDWDQVHAHLGCTVGRRPICNKSSLRRGDAEAKTTFLPASLEAYSRIM